MEDSAFVYEVHNYEPKTLLAGECTHCGDARTSRRHPHVFCKAIGLMACVCTLPKRALIHQMTGV